MGSDVGVVEIEEDTALDHEELDEPPELCLMCPKFVHLPKTDPLKDAQLLY